MVIQSAIRVFMSTYGKIEMQEELSINIYVIVAKNITTNTAKSLEEAVFLIE